MMATSKPCPECGEPDLFRKAKDICRECKRLLSMGRECARLYDSKDKTKTPISIPRFHHWLPYIHYGGKVPRQKFQDATLDLVRAIGEFVEDDAGNRREGEGHHYVDGENLIPGSDAHSEIYILPKAVVELLRKLYESGDAMAQNAHEEGEEKGRDLLMGLATGDVSIKELNEATIREERKWS